MAVRTHTRQSSHLDQALEQLREQDIGAVPQPTCQREAIELLHSLRRLEAEAIRRLQRSEGASISIVEGFLTVDRMLEHKTDSTRSRVWGRVVEWVIAHDATGRALHSGVLSVDQVDMLARNAYNLTDAYEADEDTLIALARGRSLDDFARAVSRWRERVAPELTKNNTKRVYENRGLWMQGDLQGGCTGRFHLDPVGSEALATALTTNPDPTTGPIPPRSLSQRRADALVDIANEHLGRGPGDSGRDLLEPTGARRQPTSIQVVIDLRTLLGEHADLGSIRRELGRTGHVPPHIAEQLMCDASYRRILFDGPNQVLNTGDSRAEIPTALRKTVQVRDRHCQFSGCNRAWYHCDLHHLVPRESRGLTSERNLVLLCSRHHTMVHQADYGISRDPATGDIVTRLPDFESDDWGLDHRGKWVKHPPPNP